MEKNILIVGVGGQGTLLTSRVLGAAAMAEGYDVKLSEVHGMAQRGGSVVTHVRYAKSVASPIIDKGCADIIIAFEELEALRYMQYLSENGKLYVNSQRIMPLPVAAGNAEYPGDIERRITDNVKNAVFVDALGLAKEAGDARALNTVMLGAVSGDTGLSSQSFEQAIKATVKSAFIELNLNAYALGRAAKKQ